MNTFFIFFYTLIWVIFSQDFTLEILILGLLFSYILTNINKSLLRYSNPKLKFGYFVLFFEYLFVLLVEIIKANIHVALIILNPNPNLDSEIIQYHTKLKSDFHRMIFANSITLTPGTLTVSLDNNLLKVHCLKKDFESGILNSKFEKILLAIEERYYD